MKTPVLTAAALATALSFNAAAAGEPAPHFSQERIKSVAACVHKIGDLVAAHDTRKPDDDIYTYYYDNEAHKIAVKTAVQTGRYETERAHLRRLGKLEGLLRYNLSAHRMFHCAVLADENGDIDKTGGGREVTRDYIEFAAEFVKTHDEKMAIIRHLKAEGDRLIAAGTKPVAPNVPVRLFK